MNKNTKRGIGRRKKGAEWWMVKETRVMNGARGKSWRLVEWAIGYTEKKINKDNMEMNRNEELNTGTKTWDLGKDRWTGKRKWPLSLTFWDPWPKGRAEKRTEEQLQEEAKGRKHGRNRETEEEIDEESAKERRWKGDRRGDHRKAEREREELDDRRDRRYIGDR